MHLTFGSVFLALMLIPSVILIGYAIHLRRSEDPVLRHSWWTGFLFAAGSVCYGFHFYYEHLDPPHHEALRTSITLWAGTLLVVTAAISDHVIRREFKKTNSDVG